MRTVIKLLMLPILLLSISNISKADTNGRLYLSTSLEMGSSHLNITWYFLGNDGTIVKNPKNGVNPINYKAEITNNGNNVGNYKIDANKLNINWNNGSTSSWKLEFQKGEISAINYGVTTRQVGLPANYKLSGQFAGGVVTSIASAIGTYNFKKDGSFTLNSTNTATTGDANTFTEKANKGIYTIMGNTLILSFSDGKKVVANIAVLDTGGGKKDIVINNTSYAQEG